MNSNRRITNTIWTIAIIISLVAVVFSLVYSMTVDSADPVESPSDKIAADAADPSSSPSAPPSGTDSPLGTDTSPVGTGETPTGFSPSPAAAPTILAETEDMGAEYIQKIIFLGDSTTYGLKYYGVVPAEQVWVPADGTFSLFNQSIIKIHDNLTNEDHTIEEMCTEYHPEYLIITLGINGILVMSDSDFIAQYTNLVERVQSTSPSTKIILNSIYPCTANPTPAEFNNDKIDHGNELILRVAEDTGTRYLNSASALKNEDGNLPESYTNGSDGIHMLPVAFNIILQYIRTHGYK